MQTLTIAVSMVLAIALAGAPPAAAGIARQSVAQCVPGVSGFLSGCFRQSAQGPAPATRLTLRRLVDPASRVDVQGRPIRFSLHALIQFDTLDDLFGFIDTEAGRWRFDSPAARQAFADGLLSRGVESRVVSMETELPLEILLTHTRGELERAVAGLSRRDAPLVFKGRHWQLTTDVYRDAFLRVRDRWSQSLNCWSASSSIPGRVLSNWYVIDEGIELYGATYDSTEHFWQAVKYHPDLTVGELRTLVGTLMTVDWRPWVESLAADQDFYFANAYAVEFLKKNLARERLEWFHAELGRVATDSERARAAQQRIDRAPGAPIRFAALDEKVLWGDLADVLHLIVSFADARAAQGRGPYGAFVDPRAAQGRGPYNASSTRGDRQPGSPAVPGLAAIREALVARHFDAVYLTGYAGGRFAFLSRDFQELMLEIWKVKFLKMPRLNEVIRSTAGRRLDHFLDDGDSPDIPIPIYVGYLNRIREMALEVHP